MCIGICCRATKVTSSGLAQFGYARKLNERYRLTKMTAARSWNRSAASLRSAFPMRASRPPRKSASASKLRGAVLAAASIFLFVAGCKPPSLPESTSPAAQLYVNRCGNCHAPYNPHEMTASMWDTQVTMMEVKIHQAGMPPLTSDERDAILEYL